MPKIYILVSSAHFIFSQAFSESFRCSLSYFRRAFHVLLEQGDLAGAAGFDPLWCSVLPIVFLVTVVPAALRSLISSSCVVLGWSLTFLMIINTPQGEILCGARPRGTDAHFVLHPFQNDRTNSCLLLTKLLSDGLVTNPSLVQVYNLTPEVFRQLFSLAHGGEVGIWLIDSVDRCP